MSHVKLLDLYISCDIKWNVHILQIVRQISSRLCCLRQNKREKIITKKLILFQNLNQASSKNACDGLERLRKRALRNILIEETLVDAQESSSLATIHDKRRTLTERHFSDIVSHKDHALHSLHPKVNCARPLRFQCVPSAEQTVSNTIL